MPAMRWNPFRRGHTHSRDEQLLAQDAAAEADLAAGRYELAREGFAEVVEAYRTELETRPDDPETVDRLASGLRGLTRTLHRLRRFDEASALLEEALGVSRRAVELRRAAHTGSADPELARSLRGFALVRAIAGVELDEAGKALDEAMAGHLAALTATPDEEHLAEAYATEIAQAQLLARRGQHVEAARVADLARSGHLDGLLDLLRTERSGGTRNGEAQEQESDITGPPPRPTA
jgi:tetratricopeptide (TPR) repeat protein